MRVGGLVVGTAAAIAMGVVGCTSVTGGDGTPNAADAQAYRTSMTMSSSAAAASSSARESQRQASATTQASMTTQAIQATCETLSTTSADAIDAVNAYVDAYNTDGGDIAGTEGPAVDGLTQSAQAVESSITPAIPKDLAEAFQAWVDGAGATAKAITGKASAKQFNDLIDGLNESRTKALELCDKTYR